MFTKFMSLFSRARSKNARSEIVAEALDDFIEETTSEGEEINKNEKLLLANVLCLRDLTAEDIMVPRAEIVAVKRDISFENLVKTFSNSPRLQLPVYRETLDNVLGIISMRDMLPFCFHPENFDINAVVREVSFVAPSIKLDELLEQMRTTGKHLVLVVDEFGGIDGLVTLEDLVSRILGGVQQLDTPVEIPKISPQTDGSFLMDAKLSIAEAEKVLSVKLLIPLHGDSDNVPDIETIGGLIITIAGRVPSRGEKFDHPSGLELEVIDSDLRKVKRVTVRHKPNL